MIALADRLALTSVERYKWLCEHDTYLMAELKKNFNHCYVRGEASSDKHFKMAQEYFDNNPEVDYFIYSYSAPTKSDLNYVKQSRILFYRPSKTWGRGRGGRSHFRTASCRYVRLKRQILTIFDEELVCHK